jgi:hypothetical protein
MALLLQSFETEACVNQTSGQRTLEGWEGGGLGADRAAISRGPEQERRAPPSYGENHQRSGPEGEGGAPKAGAATARNRT